MNGVISSLPRVLGIGLSWTILWGVFWAIVAVIIGVVDPDSLDPGEGPMAVAILGSMGLLSGVAFGVLLFIDSRSRPSVDLSPGRVALSSS